MTIGIGVDIVEIDRFKGAMERHPLIIERLFTKEEQNYCLSRQKPHLHFAVRFAAKEAVLKSLQTGRSKIGWKDVEIERKNSGAPEVRLHNNALNIIKEKGISNILISLSFSHSNAIASALANGS